MAQAWLAMLVIAALPAACTRGEGPVTSETREVGAFTRVAVNGGIGLTVRIGPAQPLEVRAQANILPSIDTNVEGETLRIGGTGSYTTSEASM